MKGMTVIVKTISSWVKVFIFLFGIYIIITGHLSPGGGFAGGVILASSYVLLMLAFGRDFVEENLSLPVASRLDCVGALLFALIAILGLVFGGATALAEAPDALRRRRGTTILTPHPGEMSRLVGCATTAQVQADRAGTALRFARQHGAVVVLKGHGTVVTDGERVWVNATGNPGMASGGMGDVLTGLIAGLLCQGLAPFDASQLGTFAHGLAGDLAAARRGELSLVAEDVLECVPAVFKAIEGLRAEERNVPLDPEAVRAAVMG